MFASFKWVLRLDDSLDQIARSSIATNLWRVNQFLTPKVAVSTGLDYINSVDEVLVLSNIMAHCTSPMSNLRSSRKYADWARMTAGAHIVAVVVWAGLILFSDVNDLLSGLVLFFIPLALFIGFFGLALIRKMSVANMPDLASS